MHVVVTGGAGFIGSHLVRACLDAGDAVRVLDDLSTGSRERLSGLSGEVDFVEGSVVDPDVVRRALSGCEAVYHLAALPSVVQSIEEPVRAHAVNATGTLHVLEAARSEGVSRVVLASSCAVYGDSKTLPLREDLVPDPQSPYALHKLASEHYAYLYARLHGMATVALRFFNVFGPDQDPKSAYAAVVPRFMAALCAGEIPRIHGDGLQSRDFIHVQDVVSATRAAAARARELSGQVVNVASGRRTTILELLDAIQCALGGAAAPASFEPSRPGDVRHSQADIAKAESGLGWRPRLSLEEGLAHSLAGFGQGLRP